MKMVVIACGLAVILGVGFVFLTAGLRGMVASQGPLDLYLVSMLAGILCLVWGLVLTVWVLEPRRTYGERIDE